LVVLGFIGELPSHFSMFCFCVIIPPIIVEDSDAKILLHSEKIKNFHSKIELCKEHAKTMLFLKLNKQETRTPTWYYGHSLAIGQNLLASQ
jgi:hypothetical protein